MTLMQALSTCRVLQERLLQNHARAERGAGGGSRISWSAHATAWPTPRP